MTYTPKCWLKHSAVYNGGCLSHEGLEFNKLNEAQYTIPAQVAHSNIELSVESLNGTHNTQVWSGIKWQQDLNTAKQNDGADLRFCSWLVVTIHTAWLHIILLFVVG